MPECINYAFTVCTVADAGKTAVKTITRHADGSLTKKDYDRTFKWKFSTAAAVSHEAMAAWLRELASDRNTMLVMGEPVAGLDLGKAHQRLWADSSWATLRAVPREWLALDLDDVTVPPGMGRPERLLDAAVHVRDKLLPMEFCEMSMIVTPSAQSGMRGEDVARLRLLFALDRAFPLADLKRWATGLKKVRDLPVDPSVIQAGQPIYTGRPLFVGMADPIAPDLHAVIVPGFCDERVALDVSAFDAQAAVIERTVMHAARAACGDWRLLLDATLGEDGFFEPLTRALGLAARSTDSVADIADFIAALLAERADPGRRLQYNAAWTRRSVERFRRMDVQSQAEIAALHSRIFGGPING